MKETLRNTVTRDLLPRIARDPAYFLKRYVDRGDIPLDPFLRTDFGKNPEEYVILNSCR